MDLNYILLNTIVYWTISLLFGSFLSYFKYLNFSTGSYFICASYSAYLFTAIWINYKSVLFIIIFLLLILFVNFLVVNYFGDLKTRSFFWILLTISLSVFIESIISYIFWTSSISIELKVISYTELIFIFIFISSMIYYLLHISFFWKILKWIHEKKYVIESLWEKQFKLINIYLFFIISILILVWYLNIINTNISPTNNLFFLLKAIW